MIIKVCGITRVQDAEAAVRHGATAVGFVFWPKSPRYVEASRVRVIVDQVPHDVLKVGVFVDASADDVRRIVADAALSIAQLHGEETPEYAAGLGCPVWKAMDVAQCSTSREWPTGEPVVLDAIDPVVRGGTGTQLDWTRAAACARMRRVILAGGLTAENVESAIGVVRPFGVDVSSGVEQSPGIKDEAKIQQFIRAARRGLGAVQERGATA